MDFFKLCGSFMTEHALVIALVFAALNLLSFCLFWADKLKAKKGQWRISEATLILSAWIFGGLGAMLGMYLVRHKTKHIKFILLVPLAFILQMGFIILSLSAVLI